MKLLSLEPDGCDASVYTSVAFNKGLILFSVFDRGESGLQLEGAGEGGKGIESCICRYFGDAHVGGYQQLLRVKDAQAGQVSYKTAADVFGECVAEICWGEVKLLGNIAQRNRIAEVRRNIIGCAPEQLGLFRLFLRLPVLIVSQKVYKKQSSQGRDTERTVFKRCRGLFLEFRDDIQHRTELIGIKMPDQRRWQRADQPLQSLRQTRQVEQNLFKTYLRGDKTVKVGILRGEKIEIAGGKGRDCSVQPMMQSSFQIDLYFVVVMIMDDVIFGQNFALAGNAEIVLRLQPLIFCFLQSGFLLSVCVCSLYHKTCNFAI